MTTKVIYDKKAGFEIIPQHHNRAPVGFQVIRSSNNEVVGEFKMLYEAEAFLISKSRIPPEHFNVGSAAEVRHY